MAGRGSQQYFVLGAHAMLDTGAVEVRNELSKALGLDLPATILFDYPTMDALTAHLGHLVGLATDSARDGLHSSPPARQIPAPQVTGADFAAVEQQVLAVVHSIAGADVRLDTPLAAAGVDSLAAVELRNELCR